VPQREPRRKTLFYKSACSERLSTGTFYQTRRLRRAERQAVRAGCRCHGSWGVAV